MTATALRALLHSGRVTHVPGVHDPATAALAVAAGHRAVHLSGAAVSATMLGRPDLGFVPATQLADRASILVPVLNGVPVLADADTGFDDPEHAVWTGLAYHRAGISGLHLPDRAGISGLPLPDRAGISGLRLPDRAGATGRHEVIAPGPAAAKVRALADRVPELVVIARTDAYAADGLGETIRRCVAYAEAGADAILPGGVHDLGELDRISRAVNGVPLVVDRSEAAGSPPASTDSDLAAAGVRLVLHPVAALLAAMRAASLAYRAIAETGTAEQVDRLPWAAFTALAGPDETADSDARSVPAGLQT
ncbi:methylisocitrate lyase [Actinoplanes sp. SE50]|uniref:isocitrate lyase/PEP mutase family protein n=1 Tax=unclassified Actinoplanes TaxID=2626549 RepID=UPI00023EC6AB|nr:MULTISPECIES: isocitrate lyase/phosphoenolpyruvate mutase family protein [unclassified Actinoplanes]AEV86452.1 methylisocitrate lyase [Actinoplanes sp. SE50/110]ATO84850.1 methylisocitrate lyase [Actinoplanes sp. SE50]SLM02259.1 methylisocitrate lyase [Actinoplanes sp. SE50/110]